ncbi:MAG: folylpolyglutamate synthase/dihydrofolate synthase family protein [Acutalibacteraceae bacterium]|nr:folylpolyglutamate synthase/dihydrofolate synthase family protein [Acutalibacteraceae bacterium]
MNYKEAISKINSLLLFGSRPGLDRIMELLSAMGNPQDKLKYVHIAGTNGKGSTSKMISATLTASGYKTGLFISPYIIEFRERMQINGKMISENELVRCVEETYPLLEELKSKGIIITEFEYITAIAFKWYAENDCDIVVLETGLGGALDCTNVIKNTLVSVITSISYDHTAILGDTIEEIAFQKSGIIKQNSNTVYHRQSGTADTVITNVAEKMYNRLFYADNLSLTVTEQDIEHTKFIYNGIEITIHLIGEHQIKNAKLALNTIEVLREHCDFNISNKNIAEGFAKAKMPARLELICKDPIVLIDGAHNPNGMEALSTAIKQYLAGKKIVCIMGMLKDKDSNSSLEYLDGLIDTVITLEPDNPRKQSKEDLAEKAVKFFDMVYPMENFTEAIEKALDISQDNGVVLVCGSLYLASQLRPLIVRCLKKREKNVLIDIEN